MPALWINREASYPNCDGIPVACVGECDAHFTRGDSMNALLIELCATQAKLIGVLSTMLREPPRETAYHAAALQVNALHERIAKLSHKLARERKSNA